MTMMPLINTFTTANNMNNKAIAAEKGGQDSSSSQPWSSSYKSCSICSFQSYISSSSSSNSSRSGKKTTPFLPPSPAAGMGMLDASFVNIHSPTDANYSNNNKNDIDSILNDALTHNNYTAAGRNNGGKSSTLQEASRIMTAYAEAAMEMIREAEHIENESDVKDDCGGEKYYCSVCIER
jgi:hypothetical protein